MAIIIWLLLSYYIIGSMGYIYIYKTNEHTLSDVFDDNDEDNEALLVNI
jgi:hypothetical protein